MGTLGVRSGGFGKVGSAGVSRLGEAMVNLTQATRTLIAQVLRQAIGLDAITLGWTVLNSAITQRMVACGVMDEWAYLRLLQTSGSELDALVEGIVIPETWFFRDREPFVFLAQYVRSQWLPARPQRVLRVLSLPCATGEEPYSVAITLLEVGFLPTQFAIDGIDISQVALTKARQALYGTRSFRSGSLVLPGATGQITTQSLQSRYFQPTPAGFQLREPIQQLVNFSQGNLLDRQLLKAHARYDVIFCRNLLIYLDQTAREQALHRLEQWLQPDGILFVGHAEMGQLPTTRFMSLRHPLAFAACKIKPQVQHTLAKPSGRQSSASSLPAQPPKGTPRKPPITATPQTKSPVKSANSGDRRSDPTDPSMNLVATARHLANQGRLNEAAILCETHLSQSPLNAEAYILLGEIHQATGKDAQAEQCFERAIYLHPSHEDGLMHLALLKEKQGDRTSATTIRQRLQRLHQTKKNSKNQ